MSRVKVAVLLAVAVAATAAVTAVAIPGPDGRIQGCYGKSNGQLRVVDTPADCRNNEIALGWNERGPQGPPGPQGPKGDPGAAPADAVKKVSGQATLATGAPAKVLFELPGFVRVSGRCAMVGGMRTASLTATNLSSQKLLTGQVQSTGFSQIGEIAPGATADLSTATIPGRGVASHISTNDGARNLLVAGRLDTTQDASTCDVRGMGLS